MLYNMSNIQYIRTNVANKYYIVHKLYAILPSLILGYNMRIQWKVKEFVIEIGSCGTSKDNPTSRLMRP